MKFLVGDRVMHRKSRRKGNVSEVNKEWGWFAVKYDDGTLKRYTDTKNNVEAVVLVPKVLERLPDPYTKY